jgi:hypothetical protein
VPARNACAAGFGDDRRVRDIELKTLFSRAADTLQPAAHRLVDRLAERAGAAAAA